MSNEPKIYSFPLERRNWSSGLTSAATAAEILDIIRNRGEISRAELSSITGLSRSTISQHVDRLAELGLVVESGKAESRGGRRAHLIRFHNDGGYVLAIDLGATSLDVAIANQGAEPLFVHSEDADVSDGPEPILSRIIEVSRDLARQLGINVAQLKGIGMGVPGPVEFSSGQPVVPPIMPGWDRYPIRDVLEKEFSCPAYVDNDVNIMALGEQWAGLGRGVDNFIFIKIGTGIGAGIVCQGRLYRGTQGCAGDVGHIGIDHVDAICSCGNRGCLEILAAGPAIARRAEEAALGGKTRVLAKMLEERGRLTSKDVGLAASKGDPVSIEIIRESGRLVGQVLAKLINFFNPSLVVFGGGVTNVGDILLASIREAIYSRSLPLATRNLSIQRSALGGRAGIIGAAALVLEQLFSPRRVARVMSTRATVATATENERV
ncbi:MAG: ROK family transcriptional regulator [Bacillota bacterium]